MDFLKKGKIAHLLCWYFISQCLEKNLTEGFRGFASNISNRNVRLNAETVFELTNRPFPSEEMFRFRADKKGVIVEEVTSEFVAVFLRFIKLFKMWFIQLLTKDGIRFNGKYIGNLEDVATAIEISPRELRQFLREVFKK